MTKWIKVEEDKPPFDEPVLGWKTCVSCRDNKPHMHNLLARAVPIHGPFMVVYHSPDPHLVAHYRKKGDHSWDHRLEPQWSPEEPSHWSKIENPYEAEK